MLSKFIGLRHITPPCCQPRCSTTAPRCTRADTSTSCSSRPSVCGTLSPGSHTCWEKMHMQCQWWHPVLKDMSRDNHVQDKHPGGHISSIYRIADFAHSARPACPILPSSSTCSLGMSLAVKASLSFPCQPLEMREMLSITCLARHALMAIAPSQFLQEFRVFLPLP